MMRLFENSMSVLSLLVLAGIALLIFGFGVTAASIANSFGIVALIWLIAFIIVAGLLESAFLITIAWPFLNIWNLFNPPNKTTQRRRRRKVGRSNFVQDYCVAFSLGCPVGHRRLFADHIRIKGRPMNQIRNMVQTVAQMTLAQEISFGLILLVGVFVDLILVSVSPMICLPIFAIVLFEWPRHGVFCVMFRKHSKPKLENTTKGRDLTLAGDPGFAIGSQVGLFSKHLGALS